MTRIDRRKMLVLGLGAAATSMTLTRVLMQEAQAAPLVPAAKPMQDPESLIEPAQVVVVGPRRRRGRRWRCWWRRGRRVCGWRW